MEQAEQLQRLVDRGALDEAVRLAKSHPDLAFALPRLHLLRRDRAAVLAIIRRLLPMAGTDSAYRLLGELAGQVGASGLRRHIASLWGEPEFLYETYLATGCPEAARKVLHAQFQQARIPTWALSRRALEELEERRLESAGRFFELAGDAFSLHQQAEVARRLGDAAQADRLERKAMRAQPDYLWTHWRQAMTHRQPARLELCAPESQGLLKDLRVAWGLAQSGYRGGEAEWHHYSGWQSLDRLALTVVAEPGLEAPALLEPLVTFHRRHLPGSQLHLTFAERTHLPDLQAMEGAIRNGNNLWLARRLKVPTPDLERGQICLVLRKGTPEYLATAGFGGHAMAFVDIEPQDIFTPTVIAHEFYHAVAGLAHTDGVKARHDPFGLMGYPGTAVPLEESYLNWQQRAHLGSPAGTAERVGRIRAAERRGRFERVHQLLLELVEHDPLHLWARTQLTRSYLRRGAVEAALAQVDERARLDPGLAGQAWAAELRLRLAGQEPRELPGLGYEAVSHLVLAELLAGHLRLSEADFECYQARGLGADSDAVAYQRAALADARGRAEAAEALLAGCSPSFTAAWRNLALLEARRGDFQAASRRLAATRGRQSRSAGQAFSEGMLAWHQRRYRQSQACYRRALQHSNHDHQGAWLRLGYQAWVLGQPCDKELRRAAAVAPASHLAACAELLLQPDRARLRELLARDPYEPMLVALAFHFAPARYRGRLARLEPFHPFLGR
ncbi:MAG: hypothetical protein AB7S38_21840 [Vulcanimicrobiota bacterium]